MSLMMLKTTNQTIIEIDQSVGSNASQPGENSELISSHDETEDTDFAPIKTISDENRRSTLSKLR